MELLVDGRPHEVLKDEPFVKTLETVRRELVASGRTIMSIFLDGVELSVEEENALFLRRAGDLGKVELRTTPAREWGLHGLGEVASALGQLGDQFRAAADLFRDGQHPQGLSRANETIGLFLKVMQALSTSLSLAGIAGGIDLKSDIEAIVASMRELESAVRVADSVAAADIAEYQLPETFERMAGKIKTLSPSATKS